MDEKIAATRIMWFLGWVLAGLVAALLVGLMASHASGFVGGTGVGLAILLATFAIGALLGFLFSVPRVMTAGPAVTPGPKEGPLVHRTSGVLQTNTNLEQISDWLTTMLVGVGLSQLNNINTGLVGFRDFVATFAPSSPSLAVVAPLILLFGLIAGFLFMYIYTRVALVDALNDTEKKLLPPDAQRAVAGALRSAAADDHIDLPKGLVRSERATVDDALDLIFELLYQPAGYKQVIAMSSELSASQAAAKAVYWFYLAAAFGQQLTAATNDNDAPLIASTRASALDAARRAVKISPLYRARLWAISDEKGPDDDLAMLRKDPEFLRIVGRQG